MRHPVVIVPIRASMQLFCIALKKEKKKKKETSRNRFFSLRVFNVFSSKFYITLNGYLLETDCRMDLMLFFCTYGVIGPLFFKILFGSN